jgi:hypothetical protein
MLDQSMVDVKGQMASATYHASTQVVHVRSQLDFSFFYCTKNLALIDTPSFFWSGWIAISVSLANKRDWIIWYFWLLQADLLFLSCLVFWFSWGFLPCMSSWRVPVLAYLYKKPGGILDYLLPMITRLLLILLTSRMLLSETVTDA